MKDENKVAVLETVETVVETKKEPILTYKGESKNSSDGYSQSITVNVFKDGVKHEKLFCSIACGQIFNSPTANCQLFVMYNAASWLQYGLKTYQNIYRIDTRELAKEIFLASLPKHNRKICLMDLNEDKLAIAKTLFKPENIIAETPYKSTNYSNMTILLVNFWQEFFEFIPDNYK